VADHPTDPQHAGGSGKVKSMCGPPELIPEGTNDVELR